MLKILITDDHAIVRQGLKHILSEEFHDALFGEAGSGVEALKMLRAQTWSVVILDINMPGSNGLEVLKDIRHDHPGLPVLMLSMHPEQQYAVRALKAGGAGYLTKDSAPDELVKAVRKVLSGGKYITASLAEALAVNINDDKGRPPHEELSDREYQVMQMLAAGKAPSEIAKELSLSVKTISTFRTRILSKMKMKTNAELIHYVIQNGLA